MTKAEIKTKKDNIVSLIEERRLRQAMVQLAAFTEELAAWELTGEVRDLERNYSLMLDYAVKGSADPDRARVYDDLVSRLLILLDRAVREANLKQQDARLYYNVLRYERMQGNKPLAELLATYRDLARRLSPVNVLNLGNADQQAVEGDRKDAEALERRIFNRLWVTFPLKGDEAEALRQLLTESNVEPEHAKELYVTGLLMAQLHNFDPRRLELMLDVYTSENEAVADRLRLTAFVALIISLFRWPGRRLPSKLAARLSLLADHPDVDQDMRLTMMELTRTRDTERINRKMRDEVMPGMMKLQPEFRQRLNDMQEELDPDSLGDNPDWQDMLEKSGMADRLREMSEIQQEGGDVMMSTFAHLKQFPFFNEAANWFLPYHADHTVVIGAGIDESITTIIGASPFLCDSDKYSLTLSIAGVPEQQRRMMLGQLQSQNIDMAALEAASLDNADTSHHNFINKYVQNLYRFFNLFRRKGEMFNPFTLNFNPYLIKQIVPIGEYGETVRLMAEFYFSHKYYDEALSLFQSLEAWSTPTPELYQKTGYSLRKLKRWDEALKYFEQAELFDGTDKWTLSNIAYINMQAGRYGKALEYYERLAKEDPENVKLTLAIGRCLTELGRYREAADAYFKADYYDPKSMKALRPLAWALLMDGDIDGSLKQYRRILAADPMPLDYMNMGHLYLIKGDYREAVNAYLTFATIEPEISENAFRQAFNADLPSLIAAGVAPDIVPLILDYISYSLK